MFVATGLDIFTFLDQLDVGKEGFENMYAPVDLILGHVHDMFTVLPLLQRPPRGPPARGGGLPYMGHIGMCRCVGYGFQTVYSSIGYINQSVWV